MVELSRTRSIAARLEIVAEAPSTNTMLRALAADADGWPHLSVLLTDNQTAGRGRLDRQWTAPPGAALAVSVLLRRLPEVAEARGWIPLAAGLAMADAVADQVAEHSVSVKWPNDVLVDGRKISGILAEVTGDAVIAVLMPEPTMTAAQLPIPTATSFASLGIEVEIDRLLARYLRSLERAVDGLAATGDAVTSGLHAAVSARCGTLGQAVRVLLPGERVLEGTADSLDPEGRLVVSANGEHHAVSAGDVVHVRPTGA